MKTIIAGSRGITGFKVVEEAIRDSGFVITEVVSGGALGVDRLGEGWAKVQGIPVKRFIPDWQTWGKVAGFLRNAEMAKYAEALIAVWDGQSRGTKNMIQEAQEHNLRVHIHLVRL